MSAKQNKIDRIDPGESTFIEFELPPGITLDEVKRAQIQVRVEGLCGCGGKLIPHPTEPLTWICDRSKWWNRKKHALLRGQIEALPRSRGNA